MSLSVVISTYSIGLLVCQLCLSFRCHLHLFHRPVCVSVVCLLPLSPPHAPLVCCVSLAVVTSTCSIGLLCVSCCCHLNVFHRSVSVSVVCLLLLSPQCVPWACLLCVSYCCHLNMFHGPVCCVSLTVVTSMCSIGLSVMCLLPLSPQRVP